MIKLKRIYQSAAKGDGCRILVDRLWPRGVSKERARIHLWLKEIAPSPNLRKWFSHESAKFDEFKDKYHHELDEKTEEVDKIRQMERKYKTVTLLYAAKDEDQNNAVVLADLIKNHKRP